MRPINYWILYEVDMEMKSMKNAIEENFFAKKVPSLIPSTPYLYTNGHITNNLGLTSDEYGYGMCH